jgi:plastocyanin
VKRVALLLAVLLVVVPAADARKKRKRHKLHGKVSHVQAKAPASWSFVPPAPTPVPTPSPTATATPSVTPSASPTPTATSTLPAPNTRSVSVRSTEYRFTLSQATVEAGPVRVQFDNSLAEDPHSLSVDGPDPAYWAFDEQDPGTVTQRTIDLQPGEYVLFCPILDHEARGMRATLTVR